MSHKTIIIFSLWTSVWSAIFNLAYTMICPGFGVAWVMFVCLAIFFALGAGPKMVFPCICSALAGMAWGQVDFLLMDLFGAMGLPEAAVSLLSVALGTFLAMYLHIKWLAKTPFNVVPFIFAGVCLTFSQGGGNIIGLGATFIIGLVLCGLCGACQVYCMEKFPLEEK